MKRLQKAILAPVLLAFAAGPAAALPCLCPGHGLAAVEENAGSCCEETPAPAPASDDCCGPSKSDCQCHLSDESPRQDFLPIASLPLPDPAAPTHFAPNAALPVVEEPPAASAISIRGSPPPLHLLLKTLRI